MSGSGCQKRRQADAVRAYRMSQDGVPHKKIAETIGVDVKQVKSRILLGERIDSLSEKQEKVIAGIERRLFGEEQ